MSSRVNNMLLSINVSTIGMQTRCCTKSHDIEYILCMYSMYVFSTSTSAIKSNH